MLTINAIYIDANVGIGTYTRALSAALPEAGTWRPPRSRLVGSTGRYYEKLWNEADMRRRAPSGVHLHPYPATALNPKAVLSVLDLVHYRSAQRVNRALIARSIRMACDLLTISHVTAEEIRAEFGRSANLVEPMPAPAFYSRRRERHRSRTIRVAYWGGWHPRKWILPAIKALADLPIELVVVGSANSFVTLPGGLRVRTVAPLSTAELVATIDSCDVALYPSSDEGYGLPVVEALLRDRPVVVQPLAAYDTFLAQSAPGVLPFDPKDPDSLVGAIEKALDVEPGAALRSLLATDLGLAKQRMREQLLAVPAIRCAVI